MTNLHIHYDQLTEAERGFVDDVFSTDMWAKANARDVALIGDDHVERAVDALARAVIESRAQANQGLRK